MYVCICSSVTASEITDAVLCGYDTFDKLQEFINVCTGCACCKEDVIQQLNIVLTVKEHV